jgi:hypothetical protein
MVSLDTIVVRSSAVLDASVDDESVLMNIETGQYYAMKLSSRAIWERMETPIRVGELCVGLADAYRAPLATVEADTLEFLNYLEAQTMIEPRAE